MLKNTDLYHELVKDIEGWFTTSAVEVSNLFLSVQEQAKIHGHMLEIGPWHGRSALLWLLHARADETVFIVDLELRNALQDNLKKLAKHPAIKCRIEPLKGSSYRIPDAEFLMRQDGQMRLLHVDGDHSAAGILNDLYKAHRLLHTHGIIIVDDFLNPRFPQITEVTMNYVSDNMHELALMACGGNKGYIVKAKFFDFWEEALSNHLEEAVRRASKQCEIHVGTFNNRPSFGFR